MLRLQIGFIFFIYSAVSLAGAEFLPPTNDPVEMQNQVNSIQQILPFSSRNNLNLIQVQHSGLIELRKHFPDFDKWVAEKPDPIMISIEQKVAATEMSYVLNADHYERMKSQIFKELQQLLLTRTTAGQRLTVDEIRQKVVVALGESLLSGAESLRGLITGVLQVLPAEKRSTIFKAGEPAVQLQMIRELGIEDKDLRSGVFQAERFGLNSKTVTVKEVLDLIERKGNIHHEFLVKLGLYLALSQATLEELDAFKENKHDLKERLLTPRDFSFLESGQGSILDVLETEMSKLFPKNEAKLRKSLRQAVITVPRQWLERKMVRVEKTTPFLKVIEVHPYLGVYRGCIGGDCSTSSSPMYPFSPWEHDYYILNAKGDFIGYISATRVQMNGGKSALYLKDMSGRNLSAENAELILHAFGKVYSYYGVDAYLVANSRFTDSQNHFSVLREVYAKYNGRKPTQGKLPVIVNITFPDTNVREFIQKQSTVFQSTAGYDHPNQHPNGAIFQPQLDLEGFKVTYRQGTLSAFKPQTPRESLLFALRLLSADENAKIDHIPDLVESEVRSVMHKLKNSEGADLQTYYKRISEVFEKYGIELSRSFRQQQENFFIEGHVMASDAFSTKDESLRVDSEKFFVTFCRRTKDFAKIGNLAKKWSGPLNQSKRVTDLMNLYANRAESADIMALLTFAAEKNVRAQEIINDEKFVNRREQVLGDYIFSDKMGNFGINANDSAVTYLRSLIVHHESTPADSIEAGIRSTLIALGLKYESLKNQEFARKLKLTVNQSLYAFQGDSDQSLSRMIFFVGEYESGRVEPALFISRLLQLYVAEPKSKTLAYAIERRSVVLKKARRDNLDFAIESLIFSFYLKKQIVPIGYFSPAINQLIKTWIFRGERDPVGSENFTRVIDSIARTPDVASYLGPLVSVLPSIEVLLKENLKINIDEFYLKLNENLNLFGVDSKSLWSDPVLKRRLARVHVGYPEAFDTRTPENFARSMSWTWDLILAGEDYERPVGLMIKNIKNLRSTAQFKSFVDKVILTSERSSTPAVFRVLVQLLAAGVIDESAKMSNESLQKLVKIDDPYVKTFAASQLLERNSRIELSVGDLRSISTLLANGDEDKMPDVLLVFSAKAMDILLETRVKDEQIQKELLETVSEDDSMKMMLKAAIAYIKNGGNVEDVDGLVADAFKNEDHRLAKKEIKAAQAERRQARQIAEGTYLMNAAAPMKALYGFFQQVKKNPNVVMDKSNFDSNLLSCWTVFNGRKFSGFFK